MKGWPWVGIKRKCFIYLHEQIKRCLCVSLRDWLQWGNIFKHVLLTRVVHTGLDAVIQGESTGSWLAPKFVVDVLSQDLGHVVVVLGEVRELLFQSELHLVIVVAVLSHDCTFPTTCHKTKVSQVGTYNVLLRLRISLQLLLAGPLSGWTTRNIVPGLLRSFMV